MNSNKNLVGIIFLACGVTAGLQAMDASAGASGKPAAPKKLWIDIMREKPYFRGRDECDLSNFIGQALSTAHVSDAGFEKFKKDLQALLSERTIDPMAKFSPKVETGGTGTLLLEKTSLDEWLQKICQRAVFRRDNETVDRLTEILQILGIDKGEFEARVGDLPIPLGHGPEETIYMVVDKALPQGTDAEFEEVRGLLLSDLERLGSLDIDKKCISRKAGNISLREYFDRAMQHFEEVQQDVTSTEEEKEHAGLALKQFPLVRDLINNFKKAESCSEDLFLAPSCLTEALIKRIDDADELQYMLFEKKLASTLRAHCQKKSFDLTRQVIGAGEWPNRKKFSFKSALAELKENTLYTREDAADCEVRSKRVARVENLVAAYEKGDELFFRNWQPCNAEGTLDGHKNEPSQDTVSVPDTEEKSKTDTVYKKKSWWRSLLSNKIMIATVGAGLLALVGGLTWNHFGRKGKTAAPAK